MWIAFEWSGIGSDLHYVCFLASFAMRERAETCVELVSICSVPFTRNRTDIINVQSDVINYAIMT